MWRILQLLTALIRLKCWPDIMYLYAATTSLHGRTGAAVAASRKLDIYFPKNWSKRSIKPSVPHIFGFSFFIGTLNTTDQLGRITQLSSIVNYLIHIYVAVSQWLTAKYAVIGYFVSSNMKHAVEETWMSETWNCFQTCCLPRGLDPALWRISEKYVSPLPSDCFDVVSYIKPQQVKTLHPHVLYLTYV